MLLDPGYSLSSKSHKTLSSSSVGMWYRRLEFLLVQGEHLPVKTSICWYSGGSVTKPKQTKKEEEKARMDSCIETAVTSHVPPPRYICWVRLSGFGWDGGGGGGGGGKGQFAVPRTAASS